VAFAKWLSLGMAAGGALLVAFALLYAHRAGLLIEDGHLLDVTVLALGIGVILGLAHWLVMGRFLKELRRLSAHVDAMARSEGRPPTWKPALGLQDVARAVERAVAGLRTRIDHLVSQRRELEVQVRIAEAERRHAEAVLNAISDAVIVTDAFNEIALANESAARVLGFELEQALRRPVDKVIPDPTLVKLVKDTRAGAGSGRGLRRNLEHKLLCGDRGNTYNVSLSCVTTRNGPQAPPEAAGVVAILRDVTKEKQIAEMKSDFVSNVSHELRTPLSSIKAYVEMLVDGEANDEQTRTEFYNIIQGETNRLQRLIDNILNISRIESGVVKVQREHIALPALIKEAIDVMQPQARAKNITLVEVPTPLFFQVFADKDMIYQATLNLIGNAIKYTPDGGRVTVEMTVDEHDRTVVVSVIDNGLGIPEQDLPHLFTKFYRVADHKKVAKGTGLGLNLVKHIIETVHAGKVRVSSSVGKGSTFSFSLPLADSTV
jgi:two-component system phosphate regulon sensor histidine kinase PhoR